MEPPADAAAVQLKFLLRPECGEDLLALLLAQPVERELVVIAHEVRPLAVLGDRRQRLERARQRSGILAREREKHGLVHREREHELELVAVLVPEELALLLRREVHLAEQHGLAVAPADEAPEVAQQLVRILVRVLGSAARLDQERHRVHSKPA